MKRLNNFVLLLAIIVLPGLAMSEDVQLESNFEITSPPSPIGSGARAMGTGGAFIAIADDATAASWNPAALIQLERPEASVVGQQDKRKTGNESVEFYDINYISASYPFTLSFVNIPSILTFPESTRGFKPEVTQEATTCLPKIAVA